MPEELRAVTCQINSPANRRIDGYRACAGSAAGHEITVLESGIGFDNASKATRALIKVMQPDILVSAGFCGGIGLNLVVGDVVLATRLLIVSSGVVNEVPVELSAAGFNFVASQPVSDHRVFGGLFVSTPAIMSKGDIATLLPTGALNPVVEMESAAVALLAAENGIPLIGIRSVSDPADEELGFSLDELCDDRMRISIPRVLFTVMRKPRIIPQIVRLSRNSKIAQASLEKSVEQLLAFV